MVAMASLKNPSVFLYGPGNAKIEEHPIPKLDDPHDVIIRISYTGVCGSDVHFWSHGGIRAKVSESHPLIMGHEASGIVESIGSSVKTLKPGDRVALEPGYPCRRCVPCKTGVYNFCKDMKFAASPGTSAELNSHGTLTKFFKTPEDFCYVLPDHIGLDEGVLVEPLSVAVHVCQLAKISIGNDVVVFGAGTIGLLCAAVAKCYGAKKIINVDVNAERLKFAEQFAATASFLPSLNDSPESIAEKLCVQFDMPDGADIVLEATGAETCISAGINVARVGGTYVQAGLGKSNVTFPITTLSEKELLVRGCFRYTGVDYRIALHLLESRQISVKELITGVVPFEQASDAWEITKKGAGIKTLIAHSTD